MKTFISILFLCFAYLAGHTQPVKNSFFGLYSIVNSDPYATCEEQVKLMKDAGYDGLEISEPENFLSMKAALDKFRFHGAYFYFQVDPDQPEINPALKDYIAALKGTGTILAPYIQSSSNAVRTAEKDAQLVRLLRQLSALAKKSNLQIAVYPHFGFYIQRTDQALELVKQIGKKNTGLSFNLCHWLATTAAGERGGLKPLLTKILPYLKMITICGASDGITTRQNIWEDYIMPLGEGSFDTYGLVEYVIRDLHFHGPVGVQCYGLKQDKVWLIKHTMETWKEYKARLEAGR